MSYSLCGETLKTFVERHITCITVEPVAFPDKCCATGGHKIILFHP
jgi:hypothetical protein